MTASKARRLFFSIINHVHTEKEPVSVVLKGKIRVFISPDNKQESILKKLWTKIRRN